MFKKDSLTLKDVNKEIISKLFELVEPTLNMLSYEVNALKERVAKLENANDPVESWEMDKKILVSDNNIDWHKGYFAKYEDGIFYVWNFGATSWTTNGDNVVGWKYAKPAEKE